MSHYSIELYQDSQRNHQPLETCQATRRGNDSTRNSTDHIFTKYEPRATRDLPSHASWEQGFIEMHNFQFS